MMKQILIVCMMWLSIGFMSCSESGKSGSKASTSTDNGDYSDSATTSSGQIGSDGNIDYSNTDGQTDLDADTDTDGDSDSDVDTDTGSNTTADTGSAPVYKDCSSNGEIGCYGNDIWCFVDDEPTELISICQESEHCTHLVNGGAQCQCTQDVSMGCYNNDIWTFDSCGNYGHRVEACEGQDKCVENSHEIFRCAKCEEYCVGIQCNECLQDTGSESGGTDSEQCTNCETDSGEDTDIPQCPSDQYMLQIDGKRCWTCPMGEEGEGICNGSAQEMRYEDAADSCPDGYRLPTVEDLMSLYEEDNLIEVPSATVSNTIEVEGDCSEQPICGQVLAPLINGYERPYPYFWLNELCTVSSEDVHYDGHLVFFVERPDSNKVKGISSHCYQILSEELFEEYRLGAFAVCVKNFQ